MIYDNENDYKESSLDREQKKDELSFPSPFPGKVDYDGVKEKEIDPLCFLPFSWLHEKAGVTK